MVSVKIVPIHPEEARDLIDELDAYQASLYPAESNHLDSLDVLGRENVKMFGARDKAGLLAMGAVKIFADYGEIKRVFVPQIHRGRGLAKRIMERLEQSLVERSIFQAKLETGILQHEAIGLYRWFGYCDCPPFGSYRPDPLSVFMSKDLKPIS
jgi:putative acetyltransferase